MNILIIVNYKVVNFVFVKISETNDTCQTAEREQSCSRTGNDHADRLPSVTKVSH